MGPIPSFGSKWKEVLGFGDGNFRPYKSRSLAISHAKPDFYQITTDDTKTTTNPVTASRPSNKLPSYPQIPRDIIFSHHNNEILISACPSSSCASSSSIISKPLFHITLSTDSVNSSGRPNITLHASADKASTVVCFAKIHFSTPLVDMMLCPPPKKSISANFSTDDIATPLFISSRTNSQDKKIKHSKSRSLYTATPSFASSHTSTSYSSRDASLPRFRIEYLIQAFDPVTSSYKYVFYYGCEAYEWRRIEPTVQCFQNSSTAAVGYESGGSMKLIRARTEEILVVYTRTASPPLESKTLSQMGLMCFRFTDSMSACAEDFDILVVVSLVSIVEKERRECHFGLSSF